MENINKNEKDIMEIYKIGVLSGDKKGNLTIDTEDIKLVWKRDTLE